MHLIIIISILLAKHGIVENIAPKETSIPVFLIDGTSKMKFENTDPFVKLDHEEFSNIVQDITGQIHPKTTIIFLEETLSTEDFITKDKLGTPFLFLHEKLKLGTAKYLPAVIEPYSILKRMYTPNRVLEVSTPYDIIGWNLKQNFYVTFKDLVNETRAESLRKHNKAMRAIFHFVQHSVGNSVVAFYTGRYNPFVSEDFAVRSNAVLIRAPRALFMFEGMHSSAPTRRSAFKQLPTVSSPKRTKQHLSTVMGYPDFKLQFDFSFTNTQWKLDTVALIEGNEEVGHTKMYVGAPWDWSFICGDPLIVPNFRDGSHVTIPFYQIQPFQAEYEQNQGQNQGHYQEKHKEQNQGQNRRRSRRGTDTDSDTGPGSDPSPDAGSVPGSDPEPDPGEVSVPAPNQGAGPDPGQGSKFGPAVNCRQYFTCNILACLFVVTICLGILIFGVLMLMNCSSNNRYDDPNGKQLIIEYKF